MFGSMSELEGLRLVVKQRIDAAAEEIFGLLKTRADYEEQLSRFKESERRHKLLDDVFNPKVQLHRSGLYIGNFILLSRINFTGLFWEVG